MSQLAVLGAGVMGGTILAALLADGQDPAQVRATTMDPAAADRLRTEHGVEVTDNVAAVRGADLVLVAVKPADVAAVLTEVAPQLADDVLVVSVCAGISTHLMESLLPAGTAVVRVMPNTPALVGAGMSVLSPGAGCSPQQLDRAARLMASCGAVQVVDEGLQDAVTAVSGSGPAYVFYLAEAMIEAGVGLGLPRPLATELTVQTVHGAAAMMRQGVAPGQLREQVTSPGGTTAAALRQLDANRVRWALADAMTAAARRSADLGN